VEVLKLDREETVHADDGMEVIEHSTLSQLIFFLDIRIILVFVLWSIYDRLEDSLNFPDSLVKIFLNVLIVKNLVDALLVRLKLADAT
jgi:hypothetical protein